MVVVGVERQKNKYEYTALDEAVAMADWFPDYLFGVQEKAGPLPSVTARRLVRQFGNSDPESLRLICDEIPLFVADIQPDIAAYVCGFPEQDLRAMLQQDLAMVVDLIDERFPPVAATSLGGNVITFRVPDTRPYIPPDAAEDERDGVHWQADALCAQTDPEMFFPEKGGTPRYAKKVCDNCDVRKQCLQYALGNDERFGIWGGMSERQRRKLKRSS